MNMRTIKFRGKNLYNNEWIFGDLIQYESGEMAIFSKKLSQYGYEATEMFNRSKVIPETVGQFTGLLDKNGKEIYEGDIVEWLFFSHGCYGEQEHYLKGCIEWHQGGFIFNVTKNDSENAGFYAISDLNTDTESDVKILGNIYDNPYLIKEE